MKTIYLYIKECPSGLKYLGITSKNPYKYLGSGKYWRNHLNFHKFKIKDIKTIILLETEDIEIISFWGLYYSKIYNIVESDSWANLMPESGYKILFTKEIRDKISKSLLGNKRTLGRKLTNETINKIKLTKSKLNLKPPMLGKKHTEETKNKMSISRKGIKNPKKGHLISKKNREALSLAAMKPVLQYDLQGNFIKEWDCARYAAKELGLIATNITQCCKERAKTVGGFKWKYKK
jgi:group I intron endonuclease